jgi:hypothetical protein
MSISSRLQNASIQFHREIYRIRPVEQGHIPKWWMQRVCWLIGGWGTHDAHQGMQAIESSMPFRLFDHFGSGVDEAGNAVFVSEPYQNYRNHDVWGWAASVAGALGLHFRILPAWDSWHFPGRTIRIEFAECREAIPCRRCYTRQQARDRSRARKAATP